MLRLKLVLLGFCISLFFNTTFAFANSLVHHQLEVTLQPEQESLVVTDHVTLPVAVDGTLVFHLHTGLEPRVVSNDDAVKLSQLSDDGLVARYQLVLPSQSREFTLAYEGRLHHELESSAVEQSRGFRNTVGLIDAKGVFLSASSHWYPYFAAYPGLTFDLEVKLPGTWRSVSQGQRLEYNALPQQVVETWREENPQREIYLIAAEFTEYSMSLEQFGRGLLAQVFLRSADQRLANKYLDATARYLKMYEQLLGPYPYSKFALVENFWETGFGMPSFTLLGPRVIRLPFIINSSYPHEILHNWWGNGVYVDTDSANWSEGITAYLADHLIKQQQGQATSYRQQTLQKYRDYALAGRDFPLSDFRGRHSPATEAVGYGKALMLFHMLRLKIGDDVFVRALQRIYAEYRFKTASFSELETVFSAESGQSLDSFFKQWVDRVGAPELALTQPVVKQAGQGYRLEFTLRQLQAGAAYELEIPLAISLAGEPEAQKQVLSMGAKQQQFEIELTHQPLRMDVDPGFDLFRKLAHEETPAAFTQLFGARELLVVLPRHAASEMKPAWQQFARDISRMGPERAEIVWDDELATLPEDRAVTVLGWENRFAAIMRTALENLGVKIEDQQVRAGPSLLRVRGHAFAWATRIETAEQDSPVPRGWITADLAGALPGLSRKLPHYHKYSYLAFSGEEPENQLKGRWPTTDSPLSAVFVSDSQRARLTESAALIEPESMFSETAMMQTVRYLADPALQGRGFADAGLDRAAEHIADAMRDAGLRPGGDNGGYFQHFNAAGGPSQKVAGLKNVVGVIPGTHPRLGAQNLVIGAHYDHLGLGWPDVREDYQGQVHAGADDNASGIAVLLELARVINNGFKPDRTLVFVAFSAEEAGRLGSKFYAQQMQAYPVNKAIAMLNLDSVGRLFDNNLMVLGAGSASEWPHIFRGIGFVTGIPSVMVSEALDASDQISFHEFGVPAVQLFSGPHADYHRPGDTIDKIDVRGLVKIARVSQQVIEYLSAREEPLTSQLTDSGESQATSIRRKVSLGTIPDFSYQGRGYRLDGVIPESPAQRAGLQKADIIIAINQVPIDGIRDVSRILKSLEPGQLIGISYRRGWQVLSTEARLSKR